MPECDQGYAVVRLGHGFLVEGVGVGYRQGEGVEVLESGEVLWGEGREFDVGREGAQREEGWERGWRGLRGWCGGCGGGRWRGHC